jgi:hypothetical protein
MYFLCNYLIACVRFQPSFLKEKQVKTIYNQYLIQKVNFLFPHVLFLHLSNQNEEITHFPPPALKVMQFLFFFSKKLIHMNVFLLFLFIYFFNMKLEFNKRKLSFIRIRLSLDRSVYIK